MFRRPAATIWARGDVDEVLGLLIGPDPERAVEAATAIVRSGEHAKAGIAMNRWSERDTVLASQRLVAAGLAAPDADAVGSFGRQLPREERQHLAGTALEIAVQRQDPAWVHVVRKLNPGSGDLTAPPQFGALLGSDVEELQVAALAVLSFYRSGREQFAAHIDALLHHPAVEVVRSAVGLLPADRATVPVLGFLLDDPRTGLAVAVAEGLARGGSPAGVLAVMGHDGAKPYARSSPATMAASNPTVSEMLTRAREEHVSVGCARCDRPALSVQVWTAVGDGIGPVVALHAIDGGWRRVVCGPLEDLRAGRMEAELPAPRLDHDGLDPLLAAWCPQCSQAWCADHRQEEEHWTSGKTFRHDSELEVEVTCGAGHIRMFSSMGQVA